MSMELQGKSKTTHDFLSLCSTTARESSFQPQEHRRHPPSSQDLFLETQDLLQPLEHGISELERETTESSRSELTEHVLPGGIGTYSIKHVPVVKHELGMFASIKPEQPSVSSSSDCPEFTVWDDSATARGQCPPLHQHPSVSNASGQPATSFALLPCRHSRTTQLDMNLIMRPERAFDEQDGEDEEFAGEKFLHEESVVKLGTKNNDQKASMPRSKHSATEQRRRSKINDRFQVLRHLIPHNDQKRDKASLLLEVIEYIRFLQEKMQKYESLYPDWHHETTSLTPWISSQDLRVSTTIPVKAIKKGSSGFVLSENADGMTSIPAVIPGAVDQSEISISTGCSYKCAENAPLRAHKSATGPINFLGNSYVSTGGEPCLGQRHQTLVLDPIKLTSDDHSQWVRSGSSADCNIGNEMHGLGKEDLIIDKGTINISSMYSQGILTSLSHALETSGIDLSLAKISVQLNLGRRAFRRPVTATTCSTEK